MKYTLPAKSLLEIETQPEGVIISEIRYPGDSLHKVFICNDRIEEVLNILQLSLATLNELENC